MDLGTGPASGPASLSSDPAASWSLSRRREVMTGGQSPHCTRAIRLCSWLSESRRWVFTWCGEERGRGRGTASENIKMVKGLPVALCSRTNSQPDQVKGFPHSRQPDVPQQLHLHVHRLLWQNTNTFNTNSSCPSSGLGGPAPHHCLKLDYSTSFLTLFKSSFFRWKSQRLSSGR